MPATRPIYRSDLAGQEEGKLPREMRIFVGEFAIVRDGQEKHLELAGTPVQACGVMVGPETDGSGIIQASIRATTQGKRCPELGIGLGGPGGYRLWLMPMTSQLQIVKGDQVLASVPFTWRTGRWTTLRLQITPNADGCLIQGKAWDSATTQPQPWGLMLQQPGGPPAGRALLYGIPYSETPIAFDQIVINQQ